MADLVGWKAIAAHLGVSVRTAQRWERTLSLPVSRDVQATRGDEVHAHAEDVDRWLEQTATRRAEETNSDPPRAIRVEEPYSSAPGPASPPGRLGARRRDLVWASVVLAAGLFGAAVARSGEPALPRVRPTVPAGSPPSHIVGDTRGQLVGRIAIDANRNGEWDAGELFAAEPGRACPHMQAVPGLVVRWEGASRGSSAPMNCNPEPFYHGRLARGRYRVSLAIPSGWRATSATTADVEIEPGLDTHLWFTVVPAPGGAVLP